MRALAGYGPNKHHHPRNTFWVRETQHSDGGTSSQWQSCLRSTCDSDIWWFWACSARASSQVQGCSGGAHVRVHRWWGFVRARTLNISLSGVAEVVRRIVGRGDLQRQPVCPRKITNKYWGDLRRRRIHVNPQTRSLHSGGFDSNMFVILSNSWVHRELPRICPSRIVN